MEAVGPGRMLDNGQRGPVDVKVGDQVLHAKHAGNEFSLDDVEYLVIGEKDMLAVFQPNSSKEVKG